MDEDPRLQKMPEKPTLADFFEKRFRPSKQHLLQSAALAREAGHDDKVVLACLLHDISVIGFIQADHGYWGAQLVEPYVDEEVAWAIRYHQALRFFPDPEVGYEYPELYVKYFGADYQPSALMREAYEYARNHKWYMTARLVTMNDIYSFDESKVVKLEDFSDLLDRHFRQPKEGLGNDHSSSAAYVAHDYCPDPLPVARSRHRYPWIARSSAVGRAGWLRSAAGWAAPDSWSGFFDHFDGDEFSVAVFEYRGYGKARGRKGIYSFDEAASDALRLWTLGLGRLRPDRPLDGRHGDAAPALAGPRAVTRMIGVAAVPACGSHMERGRLALFGRAVEDIETRARILDLVTGGRLPLEWSRRMAKESAHGSDPAALRSYLKEWAVDDIAEQILALPATEFACRQIIRRRTRPDHYPAVHGRLLRHPLFQFLS